MFLEVSFESIWSAVCCMFKEADHKDAGLRPSQAVNN